MHRVRVCDRPAACIACRLVGRVGVVASMSVRHTARCVDTRPSLTVRARSPVIPARLLLHTLPLAWPGMAW